MTGNTENDYLLEKRLRSASPDLQRRVNDSSFVLQAMLSRFLDRFPDFTDHSLLHSLDVLYFCNQLLGREQVERLCPEECYVVIMACYLHDIGMGVSEKYFREFSRQIDFGDYFETHDRRDTNRIVRDFHNEYSGLFIRRFAALFDIPTEDLIFAVIQVSRGHRKTDLFDEKEYPDIPVEGGRLRLAFLSALVRLADEIDVASDRNPELMYDTAHLTKKQDIEAFGTHESVLGVYVEKERILLRIRPKSPEYLPLLEELAGKIQKTLDYCRDVAEKRSDLRVTQKRVELVGE